MAGILQNLDPMKLPNARLCLDCDEVYDEAQCPACASESYAFIKRWVEAPDKRARAPVLNHTSPETVAAYRALLAASPQPSKTGRLVRGSLVGLAVLGAAGWVLQRTMRQKESETANSGPASSGST